MVQMDNRIRLVAAALAASEWPAHEQATWGAHAVHPQAKATRHFLAEYGQHPAGTFINSLLSPNFRASDLFSAAVRCQWPTFSPAEELSGRDTEWVHHLADFYVDTAIAAFFWAEHEAPWREAQSDLQRIFQNSQLANFLGQLTGRPLANQLIITPNLIYPALETIVASNATQDYLILPPPKAVGESPPWPYRDGADWVLAESCFQMSGRVLAHLAPAQRHPLQHAATVIFLGQALDEAVARFYLLRAKKENKLPQLPEIVDRLRTHLINPQTTLTDLILI